MAEIVKIDTDRCIKWMEENYGINKVAAKEIMNDFGLWIKVFWQLDNKYPTIGKNSCIRRG